MAVRNCSVNSFDLYVYDCPVDWFCKVCPYRISPCHKMMSSIMFMFEHYMTELQQQKAKPVHIVYDFIVGQNHNYPCSPLVQRLQVIYPAWSLVLGHVCNHALWLLEHPFPLVLLALPQCCWKTKILPGLGTWLSTSVFDFQAQWSWKL